MGYRTLPIGNSVDNHGKDIAFISIAYKIDLIIGYFHKVTPVPLVSKSLEDHLTPGTIHKIPILFLAPNEVINEAKKILSQVTDSPYIRIIDPKNLMEEVMKTLK